MKNLLLLVLLCANFKTEAIVEIVCGTLSQTVPFEQKANVYAGDFRTEWEQKHDVFDERNQIEWFAMQGKAKNAKRNLTLLANAWCAIYSSRKNNPDYQGISIRMTTAELKLLPSDVWVSDLMTVVFKVGGELFIDDLRVQVPNNGSSYE